jgi:RNA recognition motif-containing protein
MNIMVSNLNATVDERQLRELFGHLGTVDSIQVMMNNITGRSEKFAFVSMPVREEGENAIVRLNNMNLMGKYLEIKEVHTGTGNQDTDT